jgi:hypothetical protein
MNLTPSLSVDRIIVGWLCHTQNGFWPITVEMSKNWVLKQNFGGFEYGRIFGYLIP